MYEVYCDESRPESIYSEHREHKFMVIGGIWIDQQDRKQVKNKLDYLKKIHEVHSEFKWSSVSPSKQDFYVDVIDYFFSNPKIRFRCIVVDSYKIDMGRFHDSDSELGFYKFYYQLIVKWIDGNISYRIYLDDKKNKQNTRLPELKSFLNRASFGYVDNVLAINSKESVFVQLADLLTGAVGAAYNKSTHSEAKNKVISRIEEYISSNIQATYANEKKFNVFEIELR